MSTLARTAIDAYGWIARASHKLKSPLLLAIRLYWGWQFATDGWGKLHHLDRVGRILCLAQPSHAAPDRPLCLAASSLLAEFSCRRPGTRASLRSCFLSI